MFLSPADSRLDLPSMTHLRSYQAAIAEGYQIEPAAPLLGNTPDSQALHLAWLNTQGDTLLLPDGRLVPRVPHRQLWLTHAYTFIGRVNIRFQLLPEMELWGGHIGYAIRPSMQRRGFGTHILRLAIIEARAGGLGRLLLTCSDDNIGSIKVIEANGGVLRDIIPHPRQPGALARRYWID